ncbi:MAG: hypothetical protein HRT88_04335, partial [Lentisphaeraceae bacterium]|nr:hypothetical protein [Lentisphaeraceae bacterium]
TEIIKNDQKPVEVLCCSERLEDMLKAPLGLAGIEVNTIERPDFIHELHDEILHSMKPGDF